MNDKIRRALGEHAEAIEKVLKDEGIELAIANDGSVVPAAKYDATKADIKKLQDTLEAFEKADTKTKAEKEEATKTLEQKLQEISTNFEEYKKGVETKETQRQKTSSFEKALKNAKCNPNIIDLVIKSTDLDKLALDDKGNVPSDYIETLKQERPAIFGEVTTDSERTPLDKDKPKGKYTIEQIKNMSVDEVMNNMKDVDASL
jgi:hypothetical protein